MKVEKLFQYQTYRTGYDEKPLKLLSHHVVSYPKNFRARWYANPRSFNFSIYGSRARFQGVQLVILSKTFNISPRIDKNMYVVCSANVSTHLFILLFTDASTADDFYSSVENDVDDRIPCSKDWVTSDLIQDMNSL